jgi:hypothetical protein
VRHKLPTYGAQCPNTIYHRNRFYHFWILTLTHIQPNNYVAPPVPLPVCHPVTTCAVRLRTARCLQISTTRVWISLRRWRDNINMGIQEVGCGGMDWTDLAQDGGQVVGSCKCGNEPSIKCGISWLVRNGYLLRKDSAPCRMISLQKCAGSKRLSHGISWQWKWSWHWTGQGPEQEIWEAEESGWRLFRVTGPSLQQQFSKERNDLLHGVWTERHTACNVQYVSLSTAKYVQSLPQICKMCATESWRPTRTVGTAIVLTAVLNTYLKCWRQILPSSASE